MLPLIIKNFSKKYPAITFEIVESDSIELYKMALDNHIDLILDAGDYDHDIYEAHHILTEEILLAVPKNNPLNDNFTKNNKFRIIDFLIRHTIIKYYFIIFYSYVKTHKNRKEIQ